MLPIFAVGQAAFGQTGQSQGDSIAAQINAANELVRQEKATEAIEAYNAIEEPDADHRDELRYNLASAHYRNSDIDAAATLFAETAMSSNDRIAADSRYNLGNCHYAKALPLVDQQPDAAIAELETARQHFRSALRLDRSLSNARENLERASKLIEQIKQKQNEQQQENEDQQQEEQSDSSEEQPEQSESKENEPEENEDSSDNEDPSGKNQEQSQEQQGEDGQDGDAESSTEDSGDSNKGKDQKPSDESSQQPADDPNESQSKQQDSNQSQSQQGTQNEQETSSASEENKTGDEPPEGEVTASNESETDKEADDNDQQSALARLNNEDNGMMTRQEALKLLQSVRDRDMLRRFRQKQRQRSNRVKVEKDW
jgi:Ca-activated chloride channel family protein